MAIKKFSFVSSRFNSELEFVTDYKWDDTPAGKFVIQKVQLTYNGVEKECELRFTSGRGQAALIQYYVYIVIPAEKFAAYNVKFSLNIESWNEIKMSENIVITEIKKSEEKESEEKPVEKEPELAIAVNSDPIPEPAKEPIVTTVPNRIRRK